MVRNSHSSEKEIASDYSFQEDAVYSILKDFKNKPDARLLLVIPTGGGKTVVALKAISRLLDNGFLSKSDKVIWATHLESLRSQTKKYLSENNKKFNLHSQLPSVLEICMKTRAIQLLNDDHDGKYKLLIIDEAHHSAANTYKQFFAKKNIGIIGLTATPTRNDESELEFDKVTYSITFEELVRRNVIIKPKFEKIRTGTTILATSIGTSDENELEKFNTEARNQLIADEIFTHQDQYTKIIVFVGTNKHVRDLYGAIDRKNKSVGSPYNHIGYIYSGNNNERGITNEEYINFHKKEESSILVNCKLLNEGYDDPMIDTVIMAVPTKSILYYVQCVGRVVRNPGANRPPNVYVLELVDDLPNINYRIDNRWLFSDISDFLEPIVEDKEFHDLGSLKVVLKDIFNNHNINEEYLMNIRNDLKDEEGLSLLLFSPSEIVDRNSKWKPLLLTSTNRSKYVGIFNTVSNNIGYYLNANHEYLLFDKMQIDKDDVYFSDRGFRVDFITALKNALSEKQNRKKIERLKYIIFNKVPRYPDGFLDFLNDCYNKDEIIEQFNNRRDDYDYIVKFPLSLAGYEAYFATAQVFTFCNNFISILKNIKETSKYPDYEKLINESISNLKNVPLPLKYLNSMIYLVSKEMNNYYFDINGDSDGRV